MANQDVYVNLDTWIEQKAVMEPENSILGTIHAPEGLS